VTESNWSKVVAVFRWTYVGKPVAEEDILKLVGCVSRRRGVRAADHHLRLVSREGWRAQLDRAIVGDVIRGKRNAGDQLTGGIEEEDVKVLGNPGRAGCIIYLDMK